MSEEKIDSLIKEKNENPEKKDTSQECIPPPEPKTDDKKKDGIPPSVTTETKVEEDCKITEDDNKINKGEELNKIKNSIDNIISLTSPKEEDVKKEENLAKPKDESSDTNNTINVPKEGEDEKHQKKEQNKFDYIFPIPNNSNSKLEESKNSESPFFLYKSLKIISAL